MPDFFVDHGAYGLATNRLGLDNPTTWAVPQEGDGSATTAATAASVASVVFGSIPTTGTISVCGVSISTSGVLNAASVDAAANALATNINATTTAVGTTVAVGAPQLRNLVFARGPSGGAPAGTCQIMMRVGSTSLNHATNSSVAIAQTLSPAATLTQFAGGSGGCWGWLINPAAIGAASSIASASYGALFHRPYVTPTAGVEPGMSDIVWVRTGGGASKDITVQYPSFNVGGTIQPPSGTNKRLVFDTNTKWTGDSAVGTVRLTIESLADIQSIQVRMSASGGQGDYVCLRRGAMELRYLSGPSRGNGQLGLNNLDYSESGRNVRLKGWKFVDEAPSLQQFWPFGRANGNSGSAALTFDECDYEATSPRTFVRQIFNLRNGDGSQGLTVAFNGCRFAFNYSSVGDPGGLVLPTTSSTQTASLIFDGCAFEGFTSGFTLINSLGNLQSGTPPVRIMAKNCSGLRLPSTYLGLPWFNLAQLQSVRLILQSSNTPGVGQGMRAEDSRGIAEWLPDASPAFPTLSAIHVTAGTPWSIRLIWLQVAGLSPGAPYQAPELSMLSQLADGARTITLQMLVPTTATEGISMIVSYLDAAGVARCEVVEDMQSSSAVWANAASYPSHTARRLVLTTAHSVKGGSVIQVAPRLHLPPPSAVMQVYVDPEFTVA